MGYDVASYEWADDPVSKGQRRCKYFIDTPEDIKDLPDPAKENISGASTAFIKSTGQLVLIINGKWEIPEWMK
jgi:hypothetical protein